MSKKAKAAAELLRRAAMGRRKIKNRAKAKFKNRKRTA